MNRITARIQRILQYDFPTIFGPQNVSNYIIGLAKVVFGVHLCNEYIGSIHQTAGPSMYPTLNVQGDWVYISNFYRRGRNVKVGDVVSIKHPMFPGTRASKRILGMPGDFVLRDTPGVGNDIMIQVQSICFLRYEITSS